MRNILLTLATLALLSGCAPKNHSHEECCQHPVVIYEDDCGPDNSDEECTVEEKPQSCKSAQDSAKEQRKTVSEFWRKLKEGEDVDCKEFKDAITTLNDSVDECRIACLKPSDCPSKSGFPAECS